MFSPAPEPAAGDGVAASACVFDRGPVGLEQVERDPVLDSARRLILGQLAGR